MADLEHYPIIHLEPEWVQADEAMGSKDKAWFILPATGEWWLFKYARVNAEISTGEHWAEKIAAEIADLLGLPHSKVELAEFNGKFGSLSRRFPELSQKGTELIHGNDLLPGFVLGYERDKKFRQSNHTFTHILTAVGRAIPDLSEGAAAVTTLAGFLVLDALILNTDRHHENWALLRENRPSGVVRHWVAPTFDHASSLGRELPAEKLAKWKTEAWRPEWYARRASGAIYVTKDQKHGENPLRLVEIALRRRPEHVRPWLERLRGLNLAQLSAIVHRVPAALMPDESRQFCVSLLGFTLQHLQNLK